MSQKRQYGIAIPLALLVMVGLFTQRPLRIVYAGFTPTPTNTAIPPTETPLPTNTPVPTDTPPPAPTETPNPVVGTPNSANTPIPVESTDIVTTPSAIPALGTGPRMSNMFMIGGGLMIAMGLLAFGWWKVWQTYGQKNG